MNPLGAQLCLFILSGEHETLPQAELCAALEAEGFAFSIHDQQQRVLLMTVDSEGAKIATQRAALVNHASIVTFEAPSKEKAILQSLKDIELNLWIRPKIRFGVKVTRIRREPIPFDIDDLQAKIGSQIWNAMDGQVKVDLTNPEILFLGVINGEQFFFGPYLASRDRLGFFQRRSPLRPFFVPSAIHPKIARVMVNLSRARTGDYFLDPFCGTGGLLLEAADIGCTPVGLDIDASILMGCRQNLRHFGVPFNGTIADARAPPMRYGSVDAMATDPPYGRSSSTKGADVINLIQSSLTPFAEILRQGGHLCLALPREYFAEEIIPTDSFSILETHTMRIHRSLRRHIVVLQRK